MRARTCQCSALTIINFLLDFDGLYSIVVSNRLYMYRVCLQILGLVNYNKRDLVRNCKLSHTEKIKTIGKCIFHT